MSTSSLSDLLEARFCYALSSNYLRDFLERDKNSGGRLATQLKNLANLGCVLRAATVLYWLASSFVERVA